jgi:2-polyprenyl-3-methyl-5-hydroxy-6-metoxy-1,4-benzoquinol methylase
MILNRIQNLFSIPRRLNDLSAKTEALEKELSFEASDKWDHWLWVNKTERMDAGVDLFDPLRREFHVSRYQFAAERFTGGRVLDCACGTGYGSKILLAGMAQEYMGVDIDSETIDYAKAKYPLAEKGSYLCASGTSLPFESEAFDYICSFETLEHIEEENGLLLEFARVLKKTGKLIISTPNEWPLKIVPYHVREYDYVSFEKLLSQFFSVDQIYNQNSGAKWKYNHSQEAGIVKTTEANKHLAECYIAICRK